MKPEVLFVELRTLSALFEAVEKVELWPAASGREHKVAGLDPLRLPCLQALHQLRRDGNLAFFVRLWCPAAMRLVTDADGARREMHVRPVRVHHFLLAHSRHQEKLKPQALFCIA